MGSCCENRKKHHGSCNQFQITKDLLGVRKVLYYSFSKFSVYMGNVTTILP